MAKMKADLPEPHETKASYWYTEGTSDKEYHVFTVAQEGGLWTTEVEYGRRGAALTHGRKTKEPTTWEKAWGEFEKECTARLKKGYTKDESGAAWGGASSTAGAGEFSGVAPQLLTTMSEEDLESMLCNDEWVLQEKHDGRRWMGLGGEENRAANKKGLFIPLSGPLAEAMNKLGVCEVDGENMGAGVILFDLMSENGEGLREKPYEERIRRLEALVKSAGASTAKVVETAWTTEEKKALLKRVRTEGGEGVVAKRKDAPYVPGRPASGGSQRKFKFLESATMQVSSINEAGTSFAFHAIEGEKRVPMGNAGIPANKEAPSVGDFVEIRYQPADSGGMLYQPFYLERRDDQGPEDCGLSQIKYRKRPYFDATEDADDLSDEEQSPTTKRRRGPGL